MGGNLPAPTALHAARSRRVNRTIGEWLPEVSRKHKLRCRKGDPARSHDAPGLKALLNILPFKQRRAQASGHGYIMENTPLALNPQPDNFSCGNLLRLFYSHSSQWLLSHQARKCKMPLSAI